MSREHEAYLEAQREDDERQRQENERDAAELLTLPNDMRIVAGMLQMCERIEFGRDAHLLERGAAEIERLRSVIVDLHNSKRHVFAAAVEKAVDELFVDCGVVNTDPFGKRT